MWKAKLAEAPTGDFKGSQPWSTSGDQPLNLQKPGTSGAYHGCGPVSVEQKSPESRGHPQGPSKRQCSAGGTLKGWQAKRSKQTGQLSYARAAWEGLRVATVCEDYPRGQVSREQFVSIQRATGQLVDEFPEEGFITRLVDSYWSKGAAIMVCHEESTRDWLAVKAPTMVTWEG